jgi:hypothetical protein
MVANLFVNNCLFTYSLKTNFAFAMMVVIKISS